MTFEVIESKGITFEVIESKGITFEVINPGRYISGYTFDFGNDSYTFDADVWSFDSDEISFDRILLVDVEKTFDSSHWTFDDTDLNSFDNYYIPEVWTFDGDEPTFDHIGTYTEYNKIQFELTGDLNIIGEEVILEDEEIIPEYA